MNNDKNKQLLWKLLYDKHYFAKFENNQFNKIKNLFDALIIEIDNTNHSTILEKNKLFIKQFIKKLNTIEIPYKQEDIINNRKQELLNQFNKKTTEFNEFKPSRPPEINFSDTIEETPIDLLDTISKLNKERESDIPILQQILSSLNMINNNQQQILEILKSPSHNEIEVENLIVKQESDLINMDINE